MTPNNKIVVGVDGSCSSIAALAWAAHEARLREARLDLVYAWSIAAIAYMSTGTAIMLRTTDFNEIGREVLDSALGAVDVSNLDVTCRVIEDVAGNALVGCARDATLLVIGTHSRDPLAGLLSGSTHQHCIHDARCPVVVVPEATQP